MSLKAKRLLAELIDSMRGHGWTEADIRDLMGTEKTNPAFYPMSSMYRITSLFAYWLRYRADAGTCKEQDLVEAIDHITEGHKARRREERAWQQETIKVLNVDATVNLWGPAVGFPVVRVQTASCNLRCPTCPHPACWDGGHVTSVKGLEMAIKKVRRDEMVMLIEGGEPLLWQQGPAFLDLLYRWAIPKRQVHLRTNGTIHPRKILRDVIGLITVEPDLEVRPKEEPWKETIDWFEKECPPVWAPIISEDTAEKVKRLWYPVDPERVYPQARRPKDYNLLVRTSVEMGWKLNIVREKGEAIEGSRPNIPT